MTHGSVFSQSDVIEEPRASTATQGGQTGAAWSLPHSITTHREDTDKQGRVCIVYDAVFHPKALRLAEKDPRFKKVRQRNRRGSTQRTRRNEAREAREASKHDFFHSTAAQSLG